ACRHNPERLGPARSYHFAPAPTETGRNRYIGCAERQAGRIVAAVLRGLLAAGTGGRSQTVLKGDFAWSVNHLVHLTPERDAVDIIAEAGVRAGGLICAAAAPTPTSPDAEEFYAESLRELARTEIHFSSPAPTLSAPIPASAARRRISTSSARRATIP